ncbi:type II toxin-antitoxin system death-on-curing family toxin [Magnetospirillum sp. UT-4]|uniref:type II toxin-antitoxin system death-on-curing family toxin n=1 Tax=Magnetospirillum sp. UT-4 TaxID=2681467 RepID=UPI001573CBA9|nr:type II toxin-antitoxin system death-on-curing family toxin [Magnetospirillum sp. UT-4]
MNDVVAYVKSEHERWKRQVGPDDQYAGDTTIGISDVLEAHFLLAEFFAKTGEGLGGLGPKNIDLLHSALSRQFVEFGGKPKWTSRIHVCATLMLGLIKNHPFHDANKRTAFLVSILHLQKIGRTPTVSHETYEDFAVDIANNNLRRYTTKDAGNTDEGVDVIAKFLRRHTREIDLSMKLITYRELDQILHKHGMRLENPKHNRIDLVRYLDALSGKEISPTRIAHIGYHGASRQVSRKDIHIVRNAAKLDPENGYDSQAFFSGYESPLALINKYREPLRRLAFR